MNDNSTLNLTLNVPMEIVTELMTSIEVCMSDNKKIWDELKIIKHDVANLRNIVEKLNVSVAASGRSRFR